MSKLITSGALEIKKKHVRKKQTEAFTHCLVSIKKKLK